jgi:hypothetical protein
LRHFVQRPWTVTRPDYFPRWRGGVGAKCQMDVLYGIKYCLCDGITQTCDKGCRFVRPADCKSEMMELNIKTYSV